MIRTRLPLVSLFALLAAGCGASTGAGAEEPTPTPGPAVTLLPVDALPGDFLLRQRVTARWGEREDGFDAILQRRGDELAMFGLTPMATVTFTIRYSPSGVEITNDTGRDLPFEPERILLDVQRVFYPWLPEAPSCDACERTERVGAYSITERYEGGRLSERRFHPVDAAQSGDVIVRYHGWGSRERAPERVTIDNQAYGYQLTIETFEDTTITSP